MEINLHIQNPLSRCRSVIDCSKKINTSSLGFLSHGNSTLSLQYYSQSKDQKVSRLSNRIIASEDFSRRRPKNIPLNSTPKGFKPKLQANPSQKTGKKPEELEIPDPLAPKESETSLNPTNFSEINQIKEYFNLSNEKKFKNEPKIEETESFKSKLYEELKKELKKQTIETLSKQNNIIFTYPDIIKPDQEIEIYFNRSISSLKNEETIFIKGAFNDWKYRSFSVKLQKSDFNHEWYVCKVYIPKEAYKLDFIFYNLENLYENNQNQDFSKQIEGGINKLQFEDFLLLEKRKEIEKIRQEKAEKENKLEILRRIDSDIAALSYDKALAKSETVKKWGIIKDLRGKSVKSVTNVWFINPEDFKGGDKVKLFYNKSSGPLKYSSNELYLHGGFNNWYNGVSIISNLIQAEEMDGDWWWTYVEVDEKALFLDFVIADGLPDKAFVYDNNNMKDFKALVPNIISMNKYWVEEENNLFDRLREERRIKEEMILAKAEKTLEMKEKTKEKTLKAFLLSEKEIVYTEPINIQAGKFVTIYYNPKYTVLNGKSEIWFRYSFNRWTHKLGPLPPQKMVPTFNGSHLQTSVRVPIDAYMMDFVFSENENGGLFDNKNGIDYHIPVFNGITKEPPMHIVHIAVEMAPIAKVGGLGDVVTSLSRAVQDMNNIVDIILPKYDCLNLSNVKEFHYQQSFSWGNTEIKVWFGKVEGLNVYFIEPQNGYFWTGSIYGCKNDGERFNFFCNAALEFLQQTGFRPDIIHCHDWSSAPVSWLFKENYMNCGLKKARVVFTIHNLEFGAPNIRKAMAFADKATTVSPTYMREVSENPIVGPHLHKFHGILNGIDPEIWDPYNDEYIPVCYTNENVVEGKKGAKESLQERVGLEKKSDVPLLGIITRLTHQKGIHLIKHAIFRTLERNGQVVLLGSAPDPRIQNEFINLANHLKSTYNQSARLVLSYDEPLSHLIYAGSDFILVPSIFEPCGLTQLTAMRFGSIPIVRKTGGLYDTVFDVDHDKERAKSHGLEPNGFSFDGSDAAGVDYALNRAISAWYNDRAWFNLLCKTVMEQDWSWNKPALDYLELYHAAQKGN